MGAGAESLADGLFGVLFIALGAVGDNLDRSPMGGYHCPDYCGVVHEHIMEDYGHNTDNRDAGDSSSGSSRPWVGLHVSDKVHNERCCERLKGVIRNYSKAHRHKQNSKRRSKEDFSFCKYNERYVYKTNEERR